MIKFIVTLDYLLQFVQISILQDASLIMWDEYTMSHRAHVEAVDRTLKDHRNSSALMGGITFVFAGDFRQTLPEITRASSGKRLPAGTTVIITTFKLHERFDPDNFLPERSANRHYYAFVPFSAGPRSCVGRKYAMLKLKILLSTILRNFQVHSDLKESEFKLQGDIILKRAEGFKIHFEPRKRTAKA